VTADDLVFFEAHSCCKSKGSVRARNVIHKTEANPTEIATKTSSNGSIKYSCGLLRRIPQRKETYRSCRYLRTGSSCEEGENLKVSKNGT
jgi:hypothetical protein